MSPDDVIYTERLKDVEIDDKVKLDRVLLVGTPSSTAIGRPDLPMATVLAVVEVCIALPKQTTFACLSSPRIFSQGRRARQEDHGFQEEAQKELQANPRSSPDPDIIENP